LQDQADAGDQANANYIFEDLQQNELASDQEFSSSDLEQIIREPLIEHVKSVFRIDPLPVRGYQKAAAGIVLLSVLLSQILLYYNYKTRRSQEPKAIKHMLCR